MSVAGDWLVAALCAAHLTPKKDADLWLASARALRAGKWQSLGLSSELFLRSKRVSPVFSHGNWSHLLVNCVGLNCFAEALSSQKKVRQTEVAQIFLTSGVLGTLLQLRVTPFARICGASGGVFGLLGACSVLAPEEKVALYTPLPVTLSMRQLAQISAVTNVIGVCARRSGGIAWAAHLGGLGYGVVHATLRRR